VAVVSRAQPKLIIVSEKVETSRVNHNRNKMIAFSLTTYTQGKNYPKHAFFILSKGLNAGKPMKQPCPNCFVCHAENAESAEQLFWVVYALHQGKQFHQALVGSVIPFIRKKELQSIIQLGLQSSAAKPEKFEKTIIQLRMLADQERNYAKLQKTIIDLKTVMVHKLIA
jgi:hypothetical protein